MLLLDYISIKGFKSIAEVRVDLRPINVVIGPNGSGKSNFIGAFAFLGAIREGRLVNTVRLAGGADPLLHFGNKVTQEIGFEVSFSNKNRYEISLQADAFDDLKVVREHALYFGPQNPEWLSYTLSPNGLEAGISRVKQGQLVAVYVRERLACWRVYHFHDTGLTSPMKRTADLNDNAFLREDAGNLAACLFRLQQLHPDAFALVSQSVQLVAPFFGSFLLRPDPLNEAKIRLEWRHKDSDAYFDVSSLSDGTLRFIALATLLLQPVELRPSVILIDEPELGLHPYAITVLAALIKQASVNTQVIVSTQSPLLLDNFEPEDVLVAERADGATTLRRLEDAPLQGWLEEYSLGQLWEKGEIGGRPRSG